MLTPTGVKKGKNDLCGLKKVKCELHYGDIKLV